MFGLFVENGPLRIWQDPKDDDTFRVHAAKHAWTDSYNVVYIDQPIGTGFSYSLKKIYNMK